MSDGEPVKYEVRLRSRRVQKELDAVNEPDYRRIAEVLKKLAVDPRPFRCEKLYDEVYRVRVGDWRVIYLIDDVRKLLAIGSVRRRSERTYKNIQDLFG